MSKYKPISKPQPHRPLAPSVTCGDSSLPEGAMGCEPFHMGLCLWEVPTVNPSVTPPACQLPLAREPFYARYRSMVRYRAFSDFQSTAWEESIFEMHRVKRG